jgi:hypothetical protein
MSPQYGWRMRTKHVSTRRRVRNLVGKRLLASERNQALDALRDRRAESLTELEKDLEL